MTDPFIFDLTRLRFQATKQDDGIVQVRWVYLLHVGGALAQDRAYHPSVSYGGGGGGVSGPSGGFFTPAYPPGLPEEAKSLFRAFEKHVAGLTAHQKLEWLLAAQKEAVDATVASTEGGAA